MIEGDDPTGTAAVPLLDVVGHGAAAAVEVARQGPNCWRLDLRTAAAQAELAVELDRCGAWVTLTHAGARPVAVRRAGWVDLRGHPAPTADRVGLGPGDAIVVPACPPGREDEHMVALLDAIGGDASALAAASARLGVDAVVVGVPTGGFSGEVLEAVTGLPAARFDEPLHPVGSPEQELWDARPDPPREARLRVDPAPVAVPAARRLLRRLMASWRMAELLDGELELLATEVVTNAVIHARTPLDVTVTYTGSAVRFDVFDRNRTVPSPTEAGPDAEGGRGLWMVRTLAAGHGIDPTPSGKHVWFTVAA